MAEPEFVLLDDAPARGPEAMVLKRAGTHPAASAVLVDLHAHPRARRTVTRLLLLLVLGAGIAAAVVTFRKRRAGIEPDDDDIRER